MKITFHSDHLQVRRLFDLSLNEPCIDCISAILHHDDHIYETIPDLTDQRAIRSAIRRLNKNPLVSATIIIRKGTKTY